LIVVEKTSRWAAALGRELGRRADVASVRSFSQCRSALAEAPASLAVIEVTHDNLERAIEFMVRAADFPQARLAALIPAEMGAAELLLREAGATVVLTTLAQAPALARLFVRHQRLAPPVQRSFEQLVAERLPWRGLAPAPG
jgi:hypothetical protein